jgi:predicted RNase H-like HicB family nuclease
MNSIVNILIEHNESGYSAYSPELEGYRAEGDSLDVVVDNIKEAIRLYLKSKENETTTKVNKPIWEIAQKLTQDITEDELNQLPTDGAEQHDHYIYGTPKIET